MRTTTSLTLAQMKIGSMRRPGARALSAVPGPRRLSLAMLRSREGAACTV